MRREPIRSGRGKTARTAVRPLQASPAVADELPAGGTLDRIDCRILVLLQQDGRITNANLAQRVGLSASPCLRRVRRLEAEGYIQKYSAVLNAEKVGFGVTVFVHVSITESTSAAIAGFRAAVAKIPQVLACHAVSGDEDFLLIVLARDLQDFKRFNDESLLHLPHVSKKISSFSLDASKQSAALPLEILPQFGVAVTGWRR